MCLIVWNWQPGSETPLLLLSNRDEFYERPCTPLHWWNSDPAATGPGSILAGRDLQAGGTWLGISRSGAHSDTRCCRLHAKLGLTSTTIGRSL